MILRNSRTLLFGADHAYGYRRVPVSETMALGPDALSTLYARLFQPTQAVLVVVGDVTLERLEPVATRFLGAWVPSAGAPLQLVREPPPLVGGPRVIHVERNSDNEVVVSIVARGPDTEGVDLAALEILARSFGGLSSRMRADVREEQGAAYVFGADVTHLRAASYLTISATLSLPASIPALRSMLATVTEAARRGIAEDELTRARTSLLSNWRSAMSSPRRIASMAGDQIRRGLLLEDLERYPARLDAVTLDDVRRVAARFLDPGALRLVVIGKAGLRPAPEQLGLGPVERRDEWGERR
jgi:zinc protease